MNAPVISLPRPGSTLLTADDRALIQMLSEGLACKQIGRRLGISALAVEKRMSRLHAKTGTENTAHLVATALRCGWLDGGDAFESAA